MGFNFQSEPFKSTVMCHFMDIGDKELVGVQVMVDRDLLHLPVCAETKIPQLAATAPAQGEMERVFIP